MCSLPLYTLLFSLSVCRFVCWLQGGVCVSVCSLLISCLDVFLGSRRAGCSGTHGQPLFCQGFRIPHTHTHAYMYNTGPLAPSVTLSKPPCCYSNAQTPTFPHHSPRHQLTHSGMMWHTHSPRCPGVMCYSPKKSFCYSWCCCCWIICSHLCVVLQLWSPTGLGLHLLKFQVCSV